MTFFSPETQKAIDLFFKRHHASSARKVAVFDADGTLWRGDLGESFFQHQIQRELIDHPQRDQLWSMYQKGTEGDDHAQAYAWLVQWNVGIAENTLQGWADAFFGQQWEARVFPAMMWLIRELHAVGFEVWMVTGSSYWVVQPGAQRLGIPHNRIISTKVHVDHHGLLTNQLVHEVPFRAGKARLVQQKIQTSPLFSAGNTFWDYELLLSSQDLALAITSEKPGEANHGSEQKLQKIAQEKQWLRESFEI